MSGAVVRLGGIHAPISHFTERLMTMDKLRERVWQREKEVGPESAIELCNQSLDEASSEDRAEVLMMRAHVHLRRGAADCAVADVSESMKLVGESPASLLTRAASLMLASQYERAIEDLVWIQKIEASMDEQPISDTARLMHAKCLLALRRPYEAEEVCGKIESTEVELIYHLRLSKKRLLSEVQVQKRDSDGTR